MENNIYIGEYWPPKLFMFWFSEPVNGICMAKGFSHVTK